MPPKKKTLSSIGKRSDSGTNKNLLGGAPLNDRVSFDPNDKTLAETSRYKTKYISLDKIKDNTQNRFSWLDTQFLEESISRMGQLQPIILIQEVDDNENLTGFYEIKAGSRRFASLKNLRENAIQNQNEEDEKRFSEAFCIILPLGATEKEIQDVITETNTLARQLSIEDVFKNFDIVFAKDDEGNFRYISKGKNKYEEGSKILKRMGFKFSPGSIKDYLSIYTAHNPKVREDFENGFFSKRQALIVARMPDALQDAMMEKFINMTDKEISEYIKTYSLEKKIKKNTKIKGVEALNQVSKTSQSMKSLTQKESIVFSDDLQKQQFLEQLDELKKYIKEIEKFIER